MSAIRPDRLAHPEGYGEKSGDRRFGAFLVMRENEFRGATLAINTLVNPAPVDHARSCVKRGCRHHHKTSLVKIADEIKRRNSTFSIITPSADRGAARSLMRITLPFWSHGLQFHNEK